MKFSITLEEDDIFVIFLNRLIRAYYYLFSSYIIVLIGSIFLFLVSFVIQNEQAQPAIHTSSSILVQSRISPLLNNNALRAHGLIHQLIRGYKIPIMSVLGDNKVTGQVDSLIYYFKRKLGSHSTVILLVFLGLCIGMLDTLSAQQCATQSKSNTQSLLKLNPEKEAYLQESINLLITMSLRGCDEPNTSHHVNLEEGDLYRHRLFVGHSCVTFPNGDRLYFLVHSGHENESIGDLSLAIDQQGRLYMNEGHVCGGIIHFYTTEKGSLETADNFIHNMKSDTDDKPFSLLS